MVQYEFRDQIAKEMEETGLKSNDKGWIQKFQQVVTELITTMGGAKKVKDEYGEVAKKWNMVGLPEETKRE